MTLELKPLRYPDNYPPTNKWDKFFLGVRWIGPDLSFFNTLRTLQAQRAVRDMDSWGGGQRQHIAQVISNILAHQLGWQSAVFLPEDSANVCFHGPRFDFIDGESALEEIVEKIAEDFRITVAQEFWRRHIGSNMGKLVDDLMLHSTKISP
jgi:hypothetical protein